HLSLLLGEWATLFLEQHPEVTGDDGHGRPQFMNGQRHGPREGTVYGSHTSSLDVFSWATPGRCEMISLTSPRDRWGGAKTKSGYHARVRSKLEHSWGRHCCFAAVFL